MRLFIVSVIICLAAVAFTSAERPGAKKIRLEDIERDNLLSERRAKGKKETIQTDQTQHLRPPSIYAGNSYQISSHGALPPPPPVPTRTIDQDIVYEQPPNLNYDTLNQNDIQYAQPDGVEEYADVSPMSQYVPQVHEEGQAHSAPARYSLYAQQMPPTGIAQGISTHYLQATQQPQFVYVQAQPVVQSTVAPIQQVAQVADAVAHEPSQQLQQQQQQQQQQYYVSYVPKIQQAIAPQQYVMVPYQQSSPQYVQTPRLSTSYIASFQPQGPTHTPSVLTVPSISHDYALAGGALAGTVAPSVAPAIHYAVQPTVAGLGHYAQAQPTAAAAFAHYAQQHQYYQQQQQQQQSQADYISNNAIRDSYHPTLDFFGHRSQHNSLIDSYIPSGVIYARQKGLYSGGSGSPSVYNTIAYSVPQHYGNIGGHHKKRSSVKAV